ncbi:MAG: Coenzyme F420 hydrogenase/dehydrogenase, beta subunit C-terminal domain [Butyrivibrio sp.]|nr:Coenzyme F420 hydrogenase/dehydrogenase, beta subunit C-terminal domain [Butyrivibrio sp.]
METQIYAGRIKDRNVLNFCSSGGAFTVLSDYFIDSGNAVLCVRYNYETDQAEFSMVYSKLERDKCRGSIYIQSYALDSWQEATQWLEDNPDNELVFFGVGCQGAAFINYCESKGLRKRVTVVDIICHGSPSPEVWKKYVASLKGNGNLTDINFRDKRIGWNKSVAVAKINGKEISLSKWRRIYSSRTILRPCCSKCPYTVIERKTDITVGDFWHIEKKIPYFFDKMGTSVFLIHTDKGAALFENIKSRLEYIESNASDCWQLNLERPTEHADNRWYFWNDYRNRSIEFVMEKYGTVSFIGRVKRKVFNLLKAGAGGVQNN